MGTAGGFLVQIATMLSAGTLTSYMDLGGSYDTVYLEVPTMASGGNLAIQAAASASGTYRRIKHPVLNSSTVAVNDFLILSAATNRFVPIPGGFRYLKVETLETVLDGALFKVVYGV